MSWGETLADDPEAFREHLKGDREDPPPAATVVAPCCGRECGADMVVDCRSIPGVAADWLCDGCRGKLLRGPNEWTRSKLHRARGAPAEAVRRERVRELAEQRMREVQARGEAADSREALQHARSRVSERGMPDETEPPGVSPES